ncbi:hypothetical protein NBRC116188_18560 [Oceaniserpentilla sp. 4NH20-0058]|uniref:hypothetical protein n=1 Tax=Oceaniserpentilla sp. 4NH20-0058 TaxID=3127660 RepID=UPI003103B220
MNRLILHIGPHKTGSTYIQRELFNSKEKLLTNNLLYPSTMLEMFGHTGLANSIKTNSLSDFKSEISDINNFSGDVILSSENFFNLDELGIKILEESLEYNDVEIIVFYRQPTIRLLSLWHEYVKSGMTLSYSEFSSRHISKPFMSEELNISIKLNLFLKYFKSGDVRIIDYDESVANKNTLRSFMEAIGRKGLLDESYAVINKRINFYDLEVLRCLHHLSKGGELKGHALRLKYFKNRYIFKEILDKRIFPFLSGNSIPLKIGGSFIDHAMADLMNNEYAFKVSNNGNFEIENILLPSSVWMLNLEMVSEIHGIYTMLVDMD